MNTSSVLEFMPPENPDSVHARLEAHLLASLGAQLRRTLDVARIQGWRFAADAALGVTLRAVTKRAIEVRVRLDDVIQDATVRRASSITDIADTIERLAAAWLKRHATGVPARRRRRR